MTDQTNEQQKPTLTEASEIKKRGYPSGSTSADQVVAPAAALRPSIPRPEPPIASSDKK